MGLFGGRKSFEKKLLDNARSAAETKIFSCPKCGTMIRTTFIGRNDTTTCNRCGRRIRADEV